MTKEAMFGMYIGQKVKHTISDDCVLLESAIDHIHVCVDKRINIKLSMFDCILILRPFESMTDEERKSYSEMTTEYLGMPFTANQIKNRLSNIKQTEYLISIGIDVFNLKDRGWAVYESEVKND